MFKKARKQVSVTVQSIGNRIDLSNMIILPYGELVVALTRYWVTGCCLLFEHCLKLMQMFMLMLMLMQVLLALLVLIPAQHEYLRLQTHKCYY